MLIVFTSFHYCLAFMNSSTLYSFVVKLCSLDCFLFYSLFFFLFFLLFPFLLCLFLLFILLCLFHSPFMYKQAHLNRHIHFTLSISYSYCDNNTVPYKRHEILLVILRKENYTVLDVFCNFLIAMFRYLSILSLYSLMYSLMRFVTDCMPFFQLYFFVKSGYNVLCSCCDNFPGS